MSDDENLDEEVVDLRVRWILFAGRVVVASRKGVSVLHHLPRFRESISPASLALVVAQDADTPETGIPIAKHFES